MRRLLLLVFTLGALSGGCAHRPSGPYYTEAAFARELQRFEGRSIWEVIEERGYPQRQFTNPDGMTVYEYVTVKTFTAPMYAYTRPSPYPFPVQTEIIGGESATLICRIWFELDSAGKTVTKVRFRGDACVAPETPSSPSPPAKPS